MDGTLAPFGVVDCDELAASLVDGVSGRLIGNRCDVVTPDIVFAASLAAPEFVLSLLSQDANAIPQMTVSTAVCGFGMVVNHLTMDDIERRMWLRMAVPTRSLNILHTRSLAAQTFLRRTCLASQCR
jgi:hypothetical protein